MVIQCSAPMASVISTKGFMTIMYFPWCQIHYLMASDLPSLIQVMLHNVVAVTQAPLDHIIGQVRYYILH